MTEERVPYGDPRPAERITAKKLAEIEAKAGEFIAAVVSATDVSASAMIDSSFAAVSQSLVAEVRRLRSLIARVYPLVDEGRGGHDELNAELEREILAQREER